MDLLAERFDRGRLIRLMQASGEPAEVYKIEFNIRGIETVKSNQPVYRTQHVAEIRLGSEYPRIAPMCRMLTPIFHPNIDASAICVGDHWVAGERLNDLFNALQLWYIEGKGDSEERAISSYGLGHVVTNFEDVKPGDFVSYSTTPPGGHSVIFIDWLRDENKKIVGFKYFSSNLSGTHGVGYGTTHFSDSTPNGHGVLRNYVHIGHVGAIKDYAAFDRAKIPQRNAYAPTQPSRILYVPAPVAAATTGGSK